MSVTPAIWAALDGHLAATSGIPDVVFENSPLHDPQRGDTYLSVEFIPTRTRPVVIGADPQKRYQGIYEITAAAPRGKGSGQVRLIAALLEERFAAHSRITGVDVVVNIEYSETKAPFDRGDFYCIPVLVGWYAFAQ